MISSPIPLKNLSFTSSPGYCTWYGQCAMNTKKPFNCYYNGPAKDPTGDEDFMKLLRKTCPSLVEDNSETRVCCDYDQLSDLATQTQVARSLFARCPACMDNFMKHFCATTCHPDMSTFMIPKGFTNGVFQSQVYNCTLTPSNESVLYVYSVTVYYDHDYGQRIFNSCKDVVYPEQSGKVMDMLCGRKDCNAQKWFDFLGDPDLDYNEAPFLMAYNASLPDEPGMVSLNASLHTCYEKSKYRCSCSDCPIVCPLPQYQVPSLFAVFLFSIVVGLLGLVLSCFIFFSCLVCAIATRKNNDYDELHSSTNSSLSINADEPNEPVTGDKLTPTEEERSTSSSLCCLTCIIGAKLEYGIKRLFYRWGRIASRFWFIVIPLCLILAVGLSCGIIFFNVTTDPVQLWSAPNSRARTEKNYFDTNFSPFYRTEQVIIKVKPGAAGPYSLTITGDTNNDKLQCGPVLDQNVFYEAFHLQEALMNITGVYTYENGTKQTVGLEDICFKPLYPDYDECTIESVFNYFQNNFTRIQFSDEFGSYNASFHVDYCSK